MSVCMWVDMINGSKRGCRLNRNAWRRLWNPWAEWLLRCTLGLIFCYVSLHKIASPAVFADVILGYDLFPARGINPIAILLPFLEGVAGGALLLGIYPRSAALLIDLMLLAFVAALGTNLVRGVSFDCGCFSFGQPTSHAETLWLMARDVILMLIGGYILIYRGRRMLSLRPTGSIFGN